MLITQKLLSVAAIATFICLTSCDNDDEKGVSQLPKDDAKSTITQFNNKATDDLQDLADAEGLKAVQDFFDLVSADDPFGRISTDKKKIRAFFQQKGKDFKKAFVPAKVAGAKTNEEEFDFNDNKGVYEWNDELEHFEKTDDANIIKIKFPTDGSTSNDAELQLTAYTEVEFYDEEFEEYVYEPEILKAALFVDNVKTAGIDLNIDWDDNGFPLTAEIALTVTPYTATVSFDVSDATTSALSVSLKLNQETLVATSVTVKYKDSNKAEEDVELIRGNVQFRNLKLQGDINVAATNETEVDWEKVVNLELLSDNKKLGDIIFVEENEQAIAYLQYADGTKEKLETVLKPVLDEVEELASDLESNG